MNEKPILLNTPMVQATLADLKTETRRLVKLPDGIRPYRAEPQPEHYDDLAKWDFLYGEPIDNGFADCAWGVTAPYRPGDVLWVRETWGITSRKLIETLPDGGRYWSAEGEGPQRYVYKSGFSLNDAPGVDRWRPSIFMPREAARLFLLVKDVRVERLQEITDEGARREGLGDPDIVYYNGALRSAFVDVWNSTIKPAERGAKGWDADPWVWVIKYERTEKPEGW